VSESAIVAYKSSGVLEEVCHIILGLNKLLESLETWTGDGVCPEKKVKELA